MKSEKGIGFFFRGSEGREDQFSSRNTNLEKMEIYLTVNINRNTDSTITAGNF